VEKRDSAKQKSILSTEHILGDIPDDGQKCHVKMSPVGKLDRMTLIINKPKPSRVATATGESESVMPMLKKSTVQLR
jgi:hypothetical protein